jgi:hypothetical protein
LRRWRTTEEAEARAQLFVALVQHRPADNRVT